MTQSRSTQAISLQLTPMQIPDALPEQTSQNELRSILSTKNPATNLNLLVRPGEPSELIVQIRNLATHRLVLDLQVEGNFPPEWCRIGTEGNEILPRQQMEAVLYFQIPEQFFENHAALKPGETLAIDYVGQLQVQTIDPETGRQHLETATFQLYVRPRSLYLNYLPAIYREVDFVGRFLKVFEQCFEPTVQALDTLWAHLDPLTAPRSMLPFLAHWVAWTGQSQIPIDRQRHLIRNALYLYRWRGTRRGLRFYLHLATGLPLDEHLDQEAEKSIGIQECFSRGMVLNEARLGEDTLLGGGRPFHFSVHLRPDTSQALDEAFIRSVIEQEKPAFCTYDLFIQPRRADHVLTFTSTDSTVSTSSGE
jgi:phage tail-like protein